MLGFEHPNLQPDVFQIGSSSDERFEARHRIAVRRAVTCRVGVEAVRIGADEQYVGAVADLELLLELRERNEGGADLSLLRLDRELAEIGGREHVADGEPERPAQFILPPV